MESKTIYLSKIHVKNAHNIPIAICLKSVAKSRFLDIIKFTFKLIKLPIMYATFANRRAYF